MKLGENVILKFKTPASVIVVVLLSLWVSIGSADPDSAAEPSSGEPEALALAEDSGDDSNSENESSDAEEVETAAVEREEFGVDFDLISENATELTELQFEAWAEDLNGTEIGWHGTVERVEETLFDDIDFQVVVDPEGGSFGERANLLVADRDLALAIPADIDVFFTGTISSVSNFIGVTVDVTDVQIEDAQGNVFEAVASGETTEDDAASGDPASFDTWSTNAAELTDIQFSDWAEQFIGTEFSWTGQVETVDEALFDDGFEIVLDIDGGEGIGERARLRVTRDEALTVPADANVSFTGTLTEADNLITLQLTFENVSFTIN